jgi:hypothetical protein
MIARYRQRFRDDLMGVWQSSLDPELGLGFDGMGLLGSTLEFRADGTGVCRNWGTGEEQGTLLFRWSKVGLQSISIVPEEGGITDEARRRLISYDFFMVRGSNLVYLYEVGPEADTDAFWEALAPLVLVSGSINSSLDAPA